MNDTTRKTLASVVGLVAVGAVIGIANNLVAGKTRHLDWVTTYPAKGKPNCPDTLPEASGAPAPTETAPAGPTGPAAPTETAPAPAAPASAEVVIPPVPADKQWLEVDPAQAKSLHASGALFVDARRTEQYEEGHVPGAVSISPWESGTDDKIGQVMFDVQADMAKPIVVYCNGGACEDSHMIGEKLWQAGHTSVYVYKDGFPNWQDSGQPVTKGATR